MDGTLGPGDVLLLCSDGLTTCVDDQEIAGLIAAEQPRTLSCRALVEAALRNGAPDNVSVIVVRAAGTGVP